MTARFSTGDTVQVRTAFPPGHIRTPFFVRGKVGVINSIAGHYANPEELAYGRAGKPDQTLYRVQFAQTALWPDYNGATADTLVVDIYEHWLEPIQELS